MTISLDTLPAARPRLLLCLDMLQDPEGLSRLGGPIGERSLSACRRVLGHARAVGWRIVHVHPKTSPAGVRAHPGLEPLPSEAIFARPGISAFSSEAFADLVDSCPTAELLIISLSTAAACLATALAAYDRRGVPALLVADALAPSPMEQRGFDAMTQIAESSPRVFLNFVDSRRIVGSPSLRLICQRDSA